MLTTLGKKYCLLDKICSVYNKDVLWIIKRFLLELSHPYDKQQIDEFIRSSYGNLYRLDYISNNLSRFLHTGNNALILHGVNSGERACLYKIAPIYNLTVTKGDVTPRHLTVCNNCHENYNYCRCAKFKHKSKHHDVLICK